tara:strand:+ start:1475 stop:2266 length:792 start_codon:yes stop_codon:yes gene_type:complete
MAYSKEKQPLAKYIFILALIFSLGCQPPEKEKKIIDPFEQIKDANAKSVLIKTIKNAGGFDTWQRIKNLSYMKHGILYFADGSVETDNVQQHRYKFHPQFSAEIIWKENDVNHRISYNANVAQQFENDRLIEKDPTQTVMSSLYVLGMPFKLLDAGTVLTTLEPVILRNGQQAQAIKANYNPKKNSNHSTTEEWIYYFDENNAAFLGSLVFHPPTYAYIENLKFTDYLPIKLPLHRKSYRTNKYREIDYLRAEFLYSDYKIAF